MLLNTYDLIIGLRKRKESDYKLSKSRDPERRHLVTDTYIYIYIYIYIDGYEDEAIQDPIFENNIGGAPSAPQKRKNVNQ